MKNLNFWISESSEENTVEPDPEPTDPVDPEPVDPVIPDPEPDTTDEDEKEDEIRVPDNIQPVNPKPQNESTFDPSTLYAVDTAKDRVQDSRNQVLVNLSPDEIEELPEPVSKIDSVNENGDVQLLFSQEMFLDQLFDGFSFSSEADYTGISDEDDEFRRL